MHGVYYADAWGSGAEFEGMMAEEMREFVAKYDEARDLLLTAWVDDRMVGSIVVQGTGTDFPGARLRWVIVEPQFHGRSIGKEMLRRALDFCRKAGFESAYLWTVEGLPQSMGLYQSFGFQIVERIPDSRYSVPRVNIRLELLLA
jgi:GNAT superfamily N-acetyltransferase